MGTIVRFFQDGGVFMIPILFVFAFGVIIAIERWTYLTVSGASSRRTHCQVESRNWLDFDLRAVPGEECPSPR